MMFSVGLYIWHLLCWGTFPLKENLYYLNFLLSGSVTLLPDNISSWYIHLLLKSLAIRKAKIIALIPNPLGYERTLYIEKSNEKQEGLFLKNRISNLLCQKLSFKLEIELKTSSEHVPKFPSFSSHTSNNSSVSHLCSFVIYFLFILSSLFIISLLNPKNTNTFQNSISIYSSFWIQLR